MFRPEKHRQVCHRGHELLAAHPAGTAGAAGRPRGCVHTALTVSSAAEGEHPHSEGHAERGTEHSNGPGGLSCTEISMQMQTDARTAGVVHAVINLPILFLSSLSLKASCGKMNVTDIFEDSKVRGKPDQELVEGAAGGAGRAGWSLQWELHGMRSLPVLWGTITTWVLLQPKGPQGAQC